MPTELEKMLAGELYDPLDPELVARRRRARDTLFGPAVQIYTATHPMNAALRRTRELAKPVAIGSDVWVGGAAIILPGVTIGPRSVIGAGSVVTRDVPEGVFARGIRAASCGP